MEWCFSRKSSHFIIIIVILYWLLQVIPASPGREYCFSFWFYVHGDRTSVNWNKLTIYILVNASHDSMSSEADLLDITGDFGDVWNSGHVNISTVYTQKPFQVRLLDIHVKQKNLSFSCCHGLSQPHLTCNSHAFFLLTQEKWSVPGFLTIISTINKYLNKPNPRRVH